MIDPDVEVDAMDPALPRYAKKGIDLGYKVGGAGGAAWGGYSGYAFAQHASEGMHWSTQVVPYTYNIAEGATVGILLGAAAGALVGGLAGTGAGAAHRAGEEVYDAVLRETVEKHGIDDAYRDAMETVGDLFDREDSPGERWK